MRATMVLVSCLGLLACGPRYEIETTTVTRTVYRLDTRTGEICLFTVGDGQMQKILCGPD